MSVRQDLKEHLQSLFPNVIFVVVNIKGKRKIPIIKAWDRGPDVKHGNMVLVNHVELSHQTKEAIHQAAIAFLNPTPQA